MLNGKPTELKKIQKFNAQDLLPSCDNPIDELRRLIKLHLGITKRGVALKNSSSDRVVDDIPIPCNLPGDTQTYLNIIADELGKQASMFEAPMKKQLRKIELYDLFLRHTTGVGTIVSAYLTALIHVEKCEKPSQLIRYCGYGVGSSLREATFPDGTKKKVRYACLERGAKGDGRHYNPELRTRIYQGMESMKKALAGARTVYDRPPKHGVRIATTKYYEVRTRYKARMQHSPRYDREQNLLYPAQVDLDKGLPNVPRNGARHIIESTSRTKASVVLLNDIYMVGRALEGLPIWPDWYAVKLGYRHGHGGRVVVDKPCHLSVDEALGLVGYVGKVPLPEPIIYPNGQDFHYLPESDFQRLVEEHLATSSK